jgi:hypothetical protein
VSGWGVCHGELGLTSNLKPFCPQEELVVGSDDFEIRVYQNEEILSEVTEVDRVLHLCAVHDSMYGYGATPYNRLRSKYSPYIRTPEQFMGSQKQPCMATSRPKCLYLCGPVETLFTCGDLFAPFDPRRSASQRDHRDLRQGVAGVACKEQKQGAGHPAYSHVKVANRTSRVWHGATENGP